MRIFDKREYRFRCCKKGAAQVQKTINCDDGADSALVLREILGPQIIAMKLLRFDLINQVRLVKSNLICSYLNRCGS